MNFKNSTIIGLLLTVIGNGPALADIRVGEGVFLNSTFLRDGQKVCNFSNGTTILVNLREDCFASGPPRASRVKGNDQSIEQSRTPTPPAEIQRSQATAGVYLNSEYTNYSRERVCNFSNGMTIKISFGESCLKHRAMASPDAPDMKLEPAPQSELRTVPDERRSLKIDVGQGITLNSSYYDYEAGERYCNFSNGLTYVVKSQQECFGQEPLNILMTKNVPSVYDQTTKSKKTTSKGKNYAPPSKVHIKNPRKCLNCGSKKIEYESSSPK